MESKFWQAGDVVAFRWMLDGKIIIAQPMRVVKDTPDETAILLVPGTTCIVPEELWQPDRIWDRWLAQKNGAWKWRRHIWQTNRILMLLRPGRYDSAWLFWDHATNAFNSYYVNFQLPFTRSHCGFDSFDLELDIVVEPDGAWQWKDEAGYHEGIQLGCISPEWVTAIDAVKGSVIDAIGKRAYPFDQTWMNYAPDPCWPIPKLPDGWDQP